MSFVRFSKGNLLNHILLQDVMYMKSLVFLPILFFLLMMVSLKETVVVKEGSKTVDILGVRIQTDTKLFCETSICGTRDGKIRIFSDNDSFVIYARHTKIGVEIQAKYIVIEVNGRKYFRRVKEGEKIRILKEFLLFGDKKYVVKVENSPKGRYPILYSKGNSTYIEFYFDKEGKLSFKKYL